MSGRPVRIVVNLAGAAGAALFAQASLQFYLRTHSLIGGAFLIEQTWFVIAFLVRQPPSAVSRNPGSWLLAFGGTFAGLLVRPAGAHPPWGVVAGLGLQLAGLAVCAMSLLALGRSFGFVAADLGLATGALRRRPASGLCVVSADSVGVPAAEHLAAQCPGHGAGQRL